MSDFRTIAKGQLFPSVVYTVRDLATGLPVDLSNVGVTLVAFSMRPEAGDAIDGGTITPTSGFLRREGRFETPPGADGRVAYDWITGDTAIPGRYVGWFSTLSGTLAQDAPPFTFEITDPASGETGGYCTVEDVKSRAGAIGRAWGGTTTPSEADVGRFIRACAGIIDAYVAARGFITPVAAAAAAAALLDLNADGALVRALDAAFPNSQGPAGDQGLRARAEARWSAGVAALAAGTHAALLLLEETVAPAPGVTTGAGSLWTTGDACDPWAAVPTWRRGQGL